MRYRLRTLLIVLALGPPAMAGVLWLANTPRAMTVLGPFVLIVVLAVAVAVGRISALLKKP